LYNHCNICNIPIYFCNIHTKYLQHTSKTSGTHGTYACNMWFQRNIFLLLGTMEACQCVEFTGVERETLHRSCRSRGTRRTPRHAVTARSTASASPKTRVCEEIPSDSGVGDGGKLKRFHRARRARAHEGRPRGTPPGRVHRRWRSACHALYRWGSAPTAGHGGRCGAATWPWRLTSCLRKEGR